MFMHLDAAVRMTLFEAFCSSDERCLFQGEEKHIFHIIATPTACVYFFGGYNWHVVLLFETAAMSLKIMHTVCSSLCHDLRLM